MEKRVKIFKSFEEQEQYYFDLMIKTTPSQRFQHLFRMQQLTNLFHASTKKARRIIIQKDGHTQ